MIAMIHSAAKVVATFFYIGNIRVAPGTFGSLPAFAICYMILHFVENNKIVFNIPGFNIPEQMIISTFLLGILATFILFIIGTISTYIYIQDKPSEDPKEVVIDEVVGQMLVIVLSAVSILFVYSSTMPQFYDDFTLKFVFLFLLPFSLFRFFDIVKPWPIGWLDDNVKGAFGIMIDDIVAGLFATIVNFAVVLFILDFYTTDASL